MAARYRSARNAGDAVVVAVVVAGCVVVVIVIVTVDVGLDMRKQF